MEVSTRCPSWRPAAFASGVRPSGALRTRWRCNIGSQLGSCQPTLHASSCARICRETIGCVAYTFVRPAYLHSCGCTVGVPIMLLRPDHGSCCLEQTWPKNGTWRSQWPMDACCVDGTLPLHSLCQEQCRLPWQPVAELDNVSAAAIKQQRSHLAGGPIGVREYPWVGIQQKHTHPQAVLPLLAEPVASPRVAVCLAGAVRSLIVPAVWRSIRERLVRGIGGGQPPTLFLVLSTGSEEARGRGREGEDPDAEQTYLHDNAQVGASLLAKALDALQPAAVTFHTGRSPQICGTPPTGQFQKWAECAKMARAHEARWPHVKFDVLMKSRPDLLWLDRPTLGRVPINEIIAKVARDPRLVVSSHDQNLFLHRSHWPMLEHFSAGRFVCPVTECSTPMWQWLQDRRASIRMLCRVWSCVLLLVSCFMFHVSCFMLPASCFLLPASCFLLPASATRRTPHATCHTLYY